MLSDSELTKIHARRDELREQYFEPDAAKRGKSPARGIHHAALICSDVEQTIQFYQGILGFPLIELVENRDYNGSSHFFFDLGNETLLGFFDFPGLGLDPGVEAIGTVQHIAISMPRDAWEAAQVPARRCRHLLRRPGHRDSGVDVLQGSGRYPDRTPQRPVDVLRGSPTRRVERRTRLRGADAIGPRRGGERRGTAQLNRK